MKTGTTIKNNLTDETITMQRAALSMAAMAARAAGTKKRLLKYF